MAGLDPAIHVDPRDKPGVRYLTAHDKSSENPDRQAGAEIEITEAMIEAGANVLLGYLGGADALPSWVSFRDLATEVYQAMAAQSHRS